MKYYNGDQKPLSPMEVLGKLEQGYSVVRVEEDGTLTHLTPEDWITVDNSISEKKEVKR